MVVVDSNDSLYASDKKFVKIVAGLVDTLISQVLDHLKTLAHPEEVREGGHAAVEIEYFDHCIEICIVHKKYRHGSLSSLI